LDQAETVTTENHEEDFAAIAWIVRNGSSSWVGPTPRAVHARWAMREQRRAARLVPRGGLPGVVFTAVVFFTVVAVAASMTPGGILSVSRTVSSVLSQRVRGPLSTTTVTPSAGHQPAQSPAQLTVSPTTQTGGAVPSSSPSPLAVGDDHGGLRSGKGGGGPSPVPTKGPDD
jgi:hypothetical protein